jgi:predicted nucleic acid-binding protein
MATSPKKICWDACSWIAHIQREKITMPNGRVVDRGALCRSVIKQAEKGGIEIICSALCLAEVCKHPGAHSQGQDKLAAYFENDYILIAPVDRMIGEAARSLMYKGYSKLKPPDAIHVATAANISGITELHTFDQKLLDLDSIIDAADGTKLRIVQPDPGGPPMPLLESESGG